jgi:hypothetical protein
MKPGSRYIKWKKWSEFGKLTQQQYLSFEAEINRFNLNLNKSSKVLEVGFGNGGFLAFGKMKGWQIYGTELNQELIRKAKHSKFRVYNYNKTKVFKNNTFDLVIALDVLEHISNEDLPLFFNDVSRILKKNKGFFIARFPNGDSPFSLPLQNGDITHKSHIGISKVDYLCQNSNLRLMAVFGELHCNYRNNNFAHMLICFLINKAKSGLNNLFRFFLCAQNKRLLFFEKNIIIKCTKI